MSEENRRPVSSRDSPLFQRVARRLVGWGLTPNQISMASILFAALAALGVSWSVREPLNCFVWGVVLIWLGVQGRLLCNLFDGLMAIEGGLKTPTGEMFNELPDRVSDTVIFVTMGCAARGFCAGAAQLGWVLSFAAMATAYVRLLGLSLTKQSFFSGPFAKQHRMATVNIGAALAIVCRALNFPVERMWYYVLVFLIAGVSVTVLVRMQRIRSLANSPK